MCENHPMRTTIGDRGQICLALSLSALLAACGDEPAPHRQPPPEQPDPRFDALRAAVQDDLVHNNASAASVAVWLDDEIIWVGGFGTVPPDGGPAPNRDTLFMIGSDTKKLTAISLLRKVAAGTTTRTTHVSELLPDLTMQLAPSFLDATVHHLLSHQGGLVDGVEATSSTTDAALHDFTYGEMAQSYYPLAPPGRFWNYCNPNFSVAGLLDQTLDGRPWADIVTTDLFGPLGMTRTVARKSAVDSNTTVGVGFANPSSRTVGPVLLPDIWESAFVRPAGLVWSTPTDMMKVARFIVDGDDNVLDDTLRAELYREQVPIYPDLPGGYGYGLFVGRGLRLHDNYYDVPVWSHGGNTWTHTSTFYILPEQRAAISILSNGVGDDFTASVVAAIETLVALPAPTSAPTPPFEPTALDALTGSYLDPFNVGELIFTRVDNHLEVSAPLLDQYAIPYDPVMTPMSTRVWLVTVQGTPLDFAFIDGPQNETYFRNREIVAIRWPEGIVWPRPPLPKGAPSRERVLAALARAQLEPLPPLMRAWRRR